eukprot:gb/GEZN01004474.1/.p1 GENE.gb/GEZN01004474.1/~~gb/GEZN01004474.1/.p1  ORF type:complete len:566 (-),score=104.52 gb/GEZN01004474.1/:262-1872(-)
MSKVRARVTQRASRILNKPPLLPPGLGLLDAALVPGFENGQDLKHPIAEVLSHQFTPVHNQLDAGLFTSKNLYVSLDAILQCQIKAADAEQSYQEIQTKIKSKVPKHETHDLCASFVNGGGAASDVMRHTQQRYQEFSQQVVDEVVKPLSDFYERAKAQRKQLHMVHELKAKSLKDQLESLDRIKSQALIQTELLKTLSKQRNDAESKGGPGGQKLAKKVKGEKAKLIKMMRQYEKELASTNQAQRVWHEQEQPQLVDALGKLERKRLSLLQECLSKYQVRFETFVIELQDSSKLLKTCMSSLNPAKAYCDNVENWVKLFGMPPEVPSKDYELPYSIEDIEAEQYVDEEGEDLASAQPSRTVSASAALVSPAAVASHRISSPSDSPYPEGFQTSILGEEGRMPLQITQDVPFAESLLPKTDNPSDLAMGGGIEGMQTPQRREGEQAEGERDGAEDEDEPEETLICTAEALFDFALPPDPDNDVTYITFKVGDRIEVFEMEDEWWYGKCNGSLGYFPFTYVRKIDDVVPPSKSESGA